MIGFATKTRGGGGGLLKFPWKRGGEVRCVTVKMLNHQKSLQYLLAHSGNPYEGKGGLMFCSCKGERARRGDVDTR